MRFQLACFLSDDLHVAVQQAERLADLTGLFAHTRIFQDRPHGIQGRHAGRGRDDPDAGVKTAAHHLGQAGVQFGIDRF